jgi:hypothetical protein
MTMNDTKDQKPADWKNYEDFAAGIATNRLPSTDALAGRTFTITLKNGRVRNFACVDKHLLAWAEGASGKKEWYEAILVAPDVYFLDTTLAERVEESLTFVVNVKTRRVLFIRSVVREPGAHPGEPRVAQEFLPGVLGDATAQPAGPEPAPTRDLVGLRGFYTYSPAHVYEHIYLSSERYAWQCLVGVQRGHGDVDLATTYRFDEGQYVFAFREFIIPVASVFFYNFADMRSTGKFIGVTAAGGVENNPAGAFIQKASMTFYPKNAEPV